MSGRHPKPPVAPGPESRTRPGFPARLDMVLGPTPAPRSEAARPVKAPVVGLSGGPPRPAGLGLDSSAVRQAMVRKLAAQGLSHSRVLAALGQVERHRFVDTALATQAYEDTSLPIGLGQTISKPSVVGRMLSLLCERPGEGPGRVLEIGTGCGYQAALLSQLAREVYSIERLRGLHDKARENLRPMRLPNLHLLLGDGMVGYPRGAPYDGIVSAAGGESIPAAWLEQLAVGGRLVAPAELAPGRQSLVVVDRTVQGYTRTVLEAVHFVPLKSGVA